MKKPTRQTAWLPAVACLAMAGCTWPRPANWFTRPTFSDWARTQHLIVISVDALDARDYDRLGSLPHFREILEAGSLVREVATVNPSLTYPAHTTVVTGVSPGRHGILANNPNQPGVLKPDWYWFRRDVKAPTLYDAAERSHMTVGALLWPVTGGADIDYNLPEIWPVRPGQDQTQLALANGTPPFLIEIDSKFGHLRRGRKQPELDDFATASVVHLIRQARPNLVLLHLTDLDHARHVHGALSDEAQEALGRQDGRLGRIFQAVRDAGIWEQTTFVVLGDHGFIDVHHAVRLNAAFRDAGLLTVDADARLADWKAYANSCDGSAHVHLKDLADAATRAAVEQLLGPMVADPAAGIESVRTGREVFGNNAAVDGVPAFVVEGRAGFCFTNSWQGPTLVPVEPGTNAEGEEVNIAVHGYGPHKGGYRTMLLASGAGIRRGVAAPTADLLDVGPTLAALLGLDLPDAEGRVLDAILEPPPPTPAE